jgi:hypothetical protein
MRSGEGGGDLAAAIREPVLAAEAEGSRRDSRSRHCAPAWIRKRGGAEVEVGGPGRGGGGADVEAGGRTRPGEGGGDRAAAIENPSLRRKREEATGIRFPRGCRRTIGGGALAVAGRILGGRASPVAPLALRPPRRPDAEHHRTQPTGMATAAHLALRTTARL